MLFREKPLNFEEQNTYMEFLNGLFKASDSSEFIALVYLTRILPIKKYATESKMNNFIEYSMTSPKDITPYIGFTEDEVRNLCDEYNMDFNTMKLWYDGYTINYSSIKDNKIENNPISIYCPNSVALAIQMHVYDSYWSQLVH